MKSITDCVRVGVAIGMMVGCARTPPDLEARRKLLAALTPARLANCTLKRYGDANDGGYLMCGNLMDEARAAYSYGIDGRDQWGCDVSRQLGTTVHQYDCFNLTRFRCDLGKFQFHEECVDDRVSAQDGRLFDTLTSHLARNGDEGKRLIVKMDVEGSEWSALATTPDSVLALIDQLAVEFHGVNGPHFLETVEKLKRHFYVAHFHANNWSCAPEVAPLTAWANEVLFVNKRIGVLAASNTPLSLPHSLDAPSNPDGKDCQPAF